MGITDFFLNKISNKEAERYEAAAYNYFGRTIKDLQEKLEKEEKSEHRLVVANIIVSIKRKLKKLKEMELKYARVKERFVHDNTKILNNAKDWFNYNEAFSDEESCRESYSVTGDDDQLDFSKRDNVIMEEIEKRFDKLLKE